MVSKRTQHGRSFVIHRTSEGDEYTLYRFDPDDDALLTPVPFTAPGRFDRRAGLTYVGGYLLTWGAAQKALANGTNPTLSPYYDYRLVPFDASQLDDPLNAPALQHGQWPKSKFWGSAVDFGNPNGGNKAYTTNDTITLISLGSFLLDFIPTPGRGTFSVWNFDPCPTAPGTTDPLPYGIYNRAGSFRDVDASSELFAFDNYVLERRRGTSDYRVWSFDPQAIIPLSYPAVQSGTWRAISPAHQIVPIGDHVLVWLPETRRYALYRFDPTSADPLVGPLRQGRLPEGFGAHSSLTGFEASAPVPAAVTEPAKPEPGTIEFMRARVKHVVYYMLENRSFDHAVGWLYEKNDKNIRVIGPKGPYDGASKAHFNVDADGKKVHQSKYHDGKLSTDWDLEMFEYDPYHDMSDTLRQMYGQNRDGYAKRERPDMSGFIWNNGNAQVMQTYTPTQLPVLNGLAGAFASSDAWFSSTPGATDTNRAIALTGSSMQQVNNFMSPPQYMYWPEQPHRPSVWKLLWANGITDWKIFNSTVWYDHVFSYQLYLEGMIPTVDANVADYVSPIDTFYASAKAGTLPAFSFLEPVWIGATGTTSYHPGADLVPGERQLNQVYDALRSSPKWDETLLIVTFDEHGGIYDHVPPPFTTNPFPNDEVDGFRFDILGPRVPAIVASPLVESKTLFRSSTGVAYDHTSILATLLDWFGVPRSRWYLGDRVKRAPTLEHLLTRQKPRKDAPEFEPPYDHDFPPTGAGTPSQTVTGLQRELSHHAVLSMTRGKVSREELAAIIDEVQSASDVRSLVARLDALQARFR